MKHFRAWPASRFGGMALAALAAVLLLRCGGVGTGGTGGFASSLITGFGSVIVGDVEFDDRTAIVLDDARERGVSRRRHDRPRRGAPRDRQVGCPRTVHYSREPRHTCLCHAARSRDTAPATR